MASETFLKISKLTKEMFTKYHDGEPQAYVHDLINMIPQNCKDLEAHQKLMIYEGIGYMVSTEERQQPALIAKLLQVSQLEWMEIIN